MNSIDIPLDVKLQEAKDNSRINWLEQAMTAFEPCVAPVTHRFTPGLYMREIFMPAGSLITSKIHKTEHPFVILSGKVSVWIGDDEEVLFEGPYVGITQPGTRRVLYIHEDTRWITFHPSEETEMEKLEAQLIEPHDFPLLKAEQPLLEAEIMSWIAVGVAAVGAVASYSSSKSAAGASKKAQKNEIEAQKELTELKRQYQLEDRKYNQDAVGAWGKFLDPALAGPQAAASGGAATPSTTASTTEDGKPITDPNDPHFARNPVAPGVNALPINHPAPFQGMQSGHAPQSLWFQRQFPDYDPNKPIG